MKANKKRKERTRNFVLKFKEPLSNKIISELSEERRFYTKYQLFDPIKIGEKVVGLIVKDSFDINYSIGQGDITASSFVQSDDNVIKKLKVMGNRIIELFELEKDYYEIIEGVDFKYLEDTILESWFRDVDVIKKIKEEFKGEEEPQLIQIKFIIRNVDGDKIINIAYENAEKMAEKRLLIEANEEYLLRLLTVIGKNG